MSPDFLCKTLPYFYAIKFLKLNKIEKVFEIKSQIVQLKLNPKPTGRVDVGSASLPLLTSQGSASACCKDTSLPQL